MPRSDRSRFLRQMIDTEAQMDEVFETLAQTIAFAVFRAQGADGTIPIERLPQLQREAGRLVDQVFVGPGRQPFDENNEPTASYPRIIAEGQKAMIEVGLERAAAILDKYLPEDLRLRLAAREVVG